MWDNIKKEIRVVGIDDAAFDKFKDKEARVFGVIFRGGQYMDGVVSDTVAIDGDDATDKIAGMIMGSRLLKLIAGRSIMRTTNIRFRASEPF